MPPTGQNQVVMQTGKRLWEVWNEVLQLLFESDMQLKLPARSELIAGSRLTVTVQEIEL